jgi:carboxylesterase type B
MEHLNMMPINRRAKEVLREIDEEPNTGAFHCVQLVISVLNRGEIEAEEDLIQTVKAMMTWRPERIMNFLMIAPNGAYNPRGWETAGDYRELAKIILDDIEEKMVRHFPWYRSGD